MRQRLAFFCAVVILFILALPASADITAKYVLPVDKITINRTTAAVSAGQSFTLQTKISPASRAHETVIWTSSDPSVATVAGGVVTAHAPGNATITARVETKTAVCSVKVRAAAPKSIKLDASSIVLNLADIYPLHVSFSPTYAASDVTWASANPSVAAVDPNTGAVKAVGYGKTRVRARTANGKIAYCAVTVSDAIHVRSMKLSAASKMLSYNETYQLTASVAPANAIASDKIITWTSSNPAAATVDETGLVTAGSTPGTTVITATTGNGRKAKCKITVKFLTVRSVALSASKLTLNTNESTALVPTFTPSNATDKSLTWTSSNPSVVSVTDAGIVKALQGGSARITAKSTVSGKSASCTVNVRSIQATVTITATGDITIGGDPRRASSSQASEAWYNKLYASYGGDFLGNLSPYFKQSDEITLVNLESCLTTSKDSANKTYTLRAKPAYVDVLTKAGVDVVGHANNHTADFGVDGTRETRSTIKNAGLTYVSGAVTATVSSVNNIKVGFCAFNQTGTSSTTKLVQAIKNLKQTAKCDIVVASVHWGTEFVYTANAAQRNIGRAAIDAGADLVAGHHSHVVSGIEKYKNKYIVYSLGTLSSALVTPEDMDAFLFQQTFKYDVKSHNVESGTVRLIPVSMSTDDSTPQNVNDAKPYVLSGTARQRVLNKIKYYSRMFASTVPDTCFS